MPTTRAMPQSEIADAPTRGAAVIRAIPLRFVKLEPPVPFPATTLQLPSAGSTLNTWVASTPTSTGGAELRLAREPHGLLSFDPVGTPRRTAPRASPRDERSRSAPRSDGIGHTRPAGSLRAQPRSAGAGPAPAGGWPVPSPAAAARPLGTGDRPQPGRGPLASRRRRSSEVAPEVLHEVRGESRRKRRLQRHRGRPYGEHSPRRLGIGPIQLQPTVELTERSDPELGARA